VGRKEEVKEKQEEGRDFIWIRGGGEEEEEEVD